MDFSQPQRQSVLGILIMFADNVQKFIRAMWAPLLILLIKPERWNLWLLGIFLLVLVVFAVIAYVQFRNFTFLLNLKQREFIIQKGVITKSNITIQLDKIQQVNINQTLVQKLVNVYSVDIDTAGSQKKEVSIRAVDHALALHLKEQLLSAISEKSATSTTPNTPEATPMLKVSWLTLLKVGLTSHYGRSIALMLGFFFYLWEGLRDFSHVAEMDDNEVTGMVQQALTHLSYSILIFGALVVLLLLNVVRTFLKFFDLHMTHTNGALQLSFGLLAKKNTLLKPVKVQVTHINQNYFQRKLNLSNLLIKQASSTEIDNQENKKSDIEIPGCSADERRQVLQMIYGNKELPELEYKPNYRYVIRAILYALPIPITFFIVTFAFNFIGTSDLWLLLPPLVLFMGILIYFKYRNYRMYISGDFIMLKSNAWDVDYEIIEPYKLQGISVTQYPWHYAPDVAHITFHTAAGDLQFDFAPYGELKPYINQWLKTVEGSRKRWM